MNVSQLFLAASIVGLALLHLMESSHDPTTFTLSEYALTSSWWLFTSSILLLACGSSLAVVNVWHQWKWRRWLLLVWVIGLIVVAVVPTEPGGDVSTIAGAIHAGGAFAAIVALLAAEVSTSRKEPSGHIFSGTCAFIATVGLALSPILGFGTSERISVLAHVAWLFVFGR